MSKLICITPRTLIEDGVEKQFANTRYINRFTERGVNTIMLTLENPQPDDIFSLCDGFLITGGTDIDPTHYGEINKGLSINVDGRLDLIDQLVIQYALKHQKPLLGICRGHQALNVFMGGSLHQDLGSFNKDHVRVNSEHNVQIVSNSLFNVGHEIMVNSYHHQAIKELANELYIIGRHIDGTIEMVAHEKLPIFAVQWHPEITPNSPYSKLIFDTFVSML